MVDTYSEQSSDCRLLFLLCKYNFTKPPYKLIFMNWGHNYFEKSCYKDIYYLAYIAIMYKLKETLKYNTTIVIVQVFFFL